MYFINEELGKISLTIRIDLEWIDKLISGMAVEPWVGE